MQSLEITNQTPSIIIGATGLESIKQNIRMIILTHAYSCPLDRGFANSGSYIDSPTPHKVAQKIAELTEAIESHEPRAIVRRIEFKSLSQANIMEGRVYPTIYFEAREGTI